MSHSTTVNNVENVNVYVAQLNGAGSSLGMQPIPANASVPIATQTFEKALVATLKTNWATTFPSASLSGNTDFGFMGPIPAGGVGGTAPQCAVDQINQDFSDWGLPTQSNVANKIASIITEEISMQGGVLGFQHGQTQLTSNETIAWMAGFATVNVTQSEVGVVYAFGAALIM